MRFGGLALGGIPSRSSSSSSSLDVSSRAGPVSPAISDCILRSSFSGSPSLASAGSFSSGIWGRIFGGEFSTCPAFGNCFFTGAALAFRFSSALCDCMVCSCFSICADFSSCFSSASCDCMVCSCSSICTAFGSCCSSTSCDRMVCSCFSICADFSSCFSSTSCDCIADPSISPGGLGLFQRFRAFSRFLRERSSDFLLSSSMSTRIPSMTYFSFPGRSGSSPVSL